MPVGKKDRTASRKRAKTAGALTAKKAVRAKGLINGWHRKACAKVNYQLVPRIECADGFTMSVQASGGHYCAPRQDKGWPYRQFEIGFPSRKEQLITKYAEMPGEYTSTVYGFVPTEIVDAIIAKHGGIKA